MGQALVSIRTHRPLGCFPPEKSLAWTMTAVSQLEKGDLSMISFSTWIIPNGEKGTRGSPKSSRCSGVARCCRKLGGRRLSRSLLEVKVRKRARLLGFNRMSFGSLLRSRFSHSGPWRVRTVRSALDLRRRAQRAQGGAGLFMGVIENPSRKKQRCAFRESAHERGCRTRLRRICRVSSRSGSGFGQGDVHEAHPRL